MIGVNQELVLERREGALLLIRLRRGAQTGARTADIDLRQEGDEQLKRDDFGGKPTKLRRYPRRLMGGERKKRRPPNVRTFAVRALAHNSGAGSVNPAIRRKTPRFA